MGVFVLSLTPKKRAADLNSLSERAADLLRHQMKISRVSLVLQLDHDLPPVKADESQLSQALVALLLNALDAAAKTDLQADRVGLVRIELQCQQEQAELTVADSGIGPSEQFTENVFEPFVTSKPEGVGLGLAVAQRVVESFGGHIGWGRANGLTIFSIRLPLAA